eukprot:SAG31_NODE_6142_length_2151_cov_2.499111_1_plen_50_part_10
MDGGHRIIVFKSFGREDGDESVAVEADQPEWQSRRAEQMSNSIAGAPADH